MNARRVLWKSVGGRDVFVTPEDPKSFSLPVRDALDHAILVESSDGTQSQRIVVRVDPVALMVDPEHTPSSDEIAIRHVLRRVDEGTLFGDNPRPIVDFLEDVGPYRLA